MNEDQTTNFITSFSMDKLERKFSSLSSRLNEFKEKGFEMDAKRQASMLTLLSDINTEIVKLYLYRQHFEGKL